MVVKYASGCWMINAKSVHRGEEEEKKKKRNKHWHRSGKLNPPKMMITRPTNFSYFKTNLERRMPNMIRDLGLRKDGYFEWSN